MAQRTRQTPTRVIRKPKRAKRADTRTHFRQIHISELLCDPITYEENACTATATEPQRQYLQCPFETRTNNLSLFFPLLPSRRSRLLANEDSISEFSDMTGDADSPRSGLGKQDISPTLTHDCQVFNMKGALVEEHTEACDLPLKYRDALAYLQAVKAKFKDDPLLYSKLVAILSDIKVQAIDNVEASLCVHDLFKEHRRFVIGFNFFMPLWRTAALML